MLRARPTHPGDGHVEGIPLAAPQEALEVHTEAVRYRLVEIGRATLTVEAEPGKPVQAEGKYVVYWKQEDGRWKWHVDIWNMNAG